MKELDDLLLDYLQFHYPGAPAAHQRCFRDLLERENPELARLILGGGEPEEPELGHVVRDIRRRASR